MVMLCSGAHTRVNADRSVSPRLHVAHHRERVRERERERERKRGSSKLLFDAALFSSSDTLQCLLYCLPKSTKRASCVTPSGQEVSLTAGSVNLSHFTSLAAEFVFGSALIGIQGWIPWISENICQFVGFGTAVSGVVNILQKLQSSEMKQGRLCDCFLSVTAVACQIIWYDPNEI